MNYKGIENSVLTKEKSCIIYGVAIILMVFHHLFAFPDRITNNYIALFDFRFLHIETLIAYFGKICIAMYAFVSGYGLTKKAMTVEKTYLMVFQQLKKFYIHYWGVFFVFVPYGIIKRVFGIHLQELIENFLGLSCSYNAEWWYVKQYVIMLLVFPFLNYVYKQWIKKLQLRNRLSISLVLACMIAFKDENLRYIMVFIVGIIFAKENLLNIFRFSRCIYAVVGLLFVFVVRTIWGGSGQLDIILTPIYIYTICILSDLNIIQKYFVPCIKVLGKYSVYIWLTHTFFIYYYFPNIVFVARYSIVILVWTLLLCIGVASIIDGILKRFFGRK